MLNFLFCGLICWLYAFVKFRKEKIIYPSVIFSFMWGAAYLYTAAILGGYGENLYLKEYYNFKYIDTYVVYVTIVTLSGFAIAHYFKKSSYYGVNLEMSESFIDNILLKYKWILWLNFGGGLLRIAIMLSTVGFDSMMDYRLAANAMMMTSSMSFAGIVFKLTAYIQMLANFYIALSGLKAGLEYLDLKKVLLLFVLYAPNQMATGGRLFILYFILFFFGAFILGRGLSIREESRRLLENYEKRVLILAFAGLLSLVGIIAMLRSGSINESKENTLDKFAYVTEGMLCTEYLMRYYPPGTFQLDKGENTTGTLSKQYLSFRKHLNHTKMSASVVCIYTRAYLDFGYWGTLAFLFIIAFLGEYISLRCLGNLTLIKFFILIAILKIFYESVMASSIPDNIPNYELIILFAIFYNRIFGKLNSEVKYE